ncbi:protein kinase [bacterium AH-315-F03]|nr:protein kinase [bacterium AH-315-F03]
MSNALIKEWLSIVDRESDNDQTRTFLALTKGAMVQHYRIVDKIGAGGMGEVYLAEDTKLDRKVALKFLPANMAQDSDLRARFTREAQATAKLNHPNIVTIYEVSEQHGRPFFCDGISGGADSFGFVKK